MATNILAIPLVQITAQTSNNEDWIDSIKYIVEDVGPEEDWPQLDLRGISFEMELRRTQDDHEVVISASTEDSRLLIGGPPDYGFLIISIPVADMKLVTDGDYVGDIVARADGHARVAVQIGLTVIEGITKWPSPA